MGHDSLTRPLRRLDKGQQERNQDT